MVRRQRYDAIHAVKNRIHRALLQRWYRVPFIYDITIALAPDCGQASVAGLAGPRHAVGGGPNDRAAAAVIAVCRPWWKKPKATVRAKSIC